MGGLFEWRLDCSGSVLTACYDMRLYEYCRLLILCCLDDLYEYGQ